MPVEMDVWFDEDDGEHSESLLVEDLGERRYRLHEFPVFTESASYLDVVEADRQPDGALRFRRVATLSGLRTWRWILPKSVVDAEEALAEFCAAVMAAGGFWQRDFGGVLQVALPPAADLDPAAWLDGQIAAAPPDDLAR
jgi:hypothetical protein